MTVDASAGNNGPDNNGASGQDNNNQDNNGGHPAWKEILDVLPSEFHSLVRPTLENWDKGVQNKLQEVHSKYEPYKEFVENEVDPGLIDQSLALVHQMNSDPESTIAQAIEAFGLDYVKKAAEEVIQQQNNQQQLNLGDGEEYEDLNNIKIEEHPFVKQLQQTVEQLQSKFTEREETEKQTEAQKAFNAQLDKLKEEHGDYDRTYVTALMSQGMDGETAVKQYHDTINQAAANLAGVQNQQKETPPVVMGADGSTGSGIPDQSVKFGDMPVKDVSNLVVQMLEQNKE